MKAKDLLLWLGAEAANPGSNSRSYGCGSLRAIRARMRASAFTQTYVTDY